MKFIQLFDRFNFTKIVVKSNQCRIYKKKLHSLFRKSAEFDYNCFIFISLLKTFMCKDHPTTYSKQNNLGYSPYLGTIHILNYRSVFCLLADITSFYENFTVRME
jgi:hypothetical protein